MIDNTKFQDKGSGYRFANSGGIQDTTLLAVATAYKTGVSRKYKTLSAAALDQTFGTCGDVHGSTKYDGEGVFLYFDTSKGCVAFNAPSGRARIGLPCLQEAEAALKAKGVTRALFVAEIYLKGEKRTRVEDVIRTSISGTTEERAQLGLAIHDIVMLDGKDLRENIRDYRKNWEILESLCGTDTKKRFHRVEGKILPGGDVSGYFKEVTERGLEGIVVRMLNSDTIHKIKPMITVDCVVIGYVEGEFEGRYGALSLLCGLTSPDGKTIQNFARVGSGFADDLRESLLARLAPKKTAAPIAMSDSDGRPILFVEPNLVVEIEGEALQEDNLAGKAWTSQTFGWDGEAYTFQKVSPCPKLTHATLAKIREDKVWNDGGTRMEQALSEKSIRLVLEEQSLATEEAKLHTREVYTKTTKGETAVKKIVVVERNAPQFHRFTIHWTDFSANRAEPVKTDVQTADTESRLAAIVEELRLDAGKKGWEKAA